MKILEAIESEGHKREVSVDGIYKREMDKTIDEKPRIQHQRTRQYHYDQASLGDRKSNLSFIKQPLPEKTFKRDQADAKRWAPSKPAAERYKKHCVSF